MFHMCRTYSSWDYSIYEKEGGDTRISPTSTCKNLKKRKGPRMSSALMGTARGT